MKTILICNNCYLNMPKITPQMADCLIFGCGIQGSVYCGSFFKRLKLLFYFIFKRYMETIKHNEKIEKIYKRLQIYKKFKKRS